MKVVREENAQPGWVTVYDWGAIQSNFGLFEIMGEESSPYELPDMLKLLNQDGYEIFETHVVPGADSDYGYEDWVIVFRRPVKNIKLDIGES